MVQFGFWIQKKIVYWGRKDTKTVMWLLETTVLDPGAPKLLCQLIVNKMG